MEPEKINLRRILTLPRELQIESLLRLPAVDVINLCKNIPELSYICKSEDFWFRKSFQLGISKKEYYNLTDLTSENRYLYFSVIIEAADLLGVIDYIDDPNQVIQEALQLSLRYGYEDVSKYIEYTIRDSSLPEDLMYAYIASGRVDLALKLLKIIDISGTFYVKYICILGVATRKGYLEFIQKALEISPTIKPLSRHIEQLIAIAAQFGRMDIVMYLFTNYVTGANTLKSAIIEAIVSGYSEIAVYLFKSYKYFTKEDIYFIIDESIQRESIDIDVLTFILNNYEYITPDELLDKLLSTGQLNTVNENKGLDFIKLLIKRGAVVNDVPLTVLLANNDLNDKITFEVTKLLAENGAELTQEGLDEIEEEKSSIKSKYLALFK